MWPCSDEAEERSALPFVVAPPLAILGVVWKVDEGLLSLFESLRAILGRAVPLGTLLTDKPAMPVEACVVVVLAEADMDQYGAPTQTRLE